MYRTPSNTKIITILALILCSLMISAHAQERISKLWLDVDVYLRANMPNP